MTNLENKASTLFHIASFPRSGNHIVRTLIEAYAHRPTEGCPNVSNDPPIYLRERNQTKKLISITDPSPIGYKAHRIREVHARELAWNAPGKLILIVRDPVDAISSQLIRRGLSNDGFLKHRARKCRIGMQDAIENYYGLVHLYRSWHADRKFLLRFEKLVDKATRLSEVNRLLAFMQLDRVDDISAVDDLFDLAKESQRRFLKTTDSELMQMNARVARQINYSYIEQLLGD